MCAGSEGEGGSKAARGGAEVSAVVANAAWAVAENASRTQGSALLAQPTLRMGCAGDGHRLQLVSGSWRCDGGRGISPRWLVCGKR